MSGCGREYGGAQGEKAEDSVRIREITITPLHIPWREPYAWAGRVHDGIRAARAAEGFRERGEA